MDYDYDEDELETAEYSNKSDFSKAEKVAGQVERCNQIRSKEMKEGYYNTDKLGNRVYVPDSRKEWISSVIALKNLLRPEILKQDVKVFKEEDFKDKEKKLVELYGVEKNKIKVIPLLDESFPLETNKLNSSKVYAGKNIKMIRGLYNSNFHRYWDAMVELDDEIYAQLNVLIDQCNYFKQEVAY